MVSQSHAACWTAVRPASRFWTPLSYLAITLAALLPRVLNLGVFLTTDEADHWLERSGQFLNALRSGDYAITAFAPHPGVTTMWLGSAGILLRRALFESGIIRTETFPIVLALTQLPLVLTHVAGVILGYWLLRRLLPASTAALAALLWAADPFVIAYSRVLHVDALVATFATLSLLAACCYWYQDQRPALLILSGVCAGLATLSKLPALAVLPIIGMIAVTAPRFQLSNHDQRHESQRFLRSWRPWRLMIWGAIVALTIVALWPVLWVDPARALAQLRFGVEVEGADPQMTSNFFLGRIDNQPGLIFYPLALVLRLTPWTLLGLLVLPLAWRRGMALAPSRRYGPAALAGFAVLFILAMSVFEKKFNRYLVPIFPALDILAAVGLAWLAARLPALLPGQSLVRALTRPIRAASMLVVGLLALLTVAWWHPYEIAYFNPTLGGARTGTRVFLAGWGEGFEQVADWLNRQPDITDVVTISPMASSLQPYMRTNAQVVEAGQAMLPDKTGYVVVYIRQVQGGPPRAPFDQFYGRTPPLHTVNVHGVAYAWIYQAPPPVAQARPADFGANIHLRGFEQVSGAGNDDTTVLKLFWQTAAAPATNYALFVHLIGPGGQRYAQVDVPYPTSNWGAHRYVTSEVSLPMPANEPAGTYHIMIGLYDPASGQRLPLEDPAPISPAIDGTGALPLMQFHKSRAE